MLPQSPASPAQRPSPQGGLEKLRQFSPNWFTLTMGTGIVFLVLNALPGPIPGQRGLAMSLWCADLVLYVVFIVLFMARCIIFPEIIGLILRHPTQSMFLGALPMGLAPVITGIVLFVGDRFGAGTYALAYMLWCFDALLAVLVAIAVPYLIFTTQRHTFERVTAVLMLPLVAPEVAATSAAALAPHLAVETARFVIGAGYILWAISVPLAFMVLTIIFFRLLIHKLPDRDVGPSNWLTLGPIGTGALGLLTLGQAAPAVFEGTLLESVALAARDVGVFAALLLWGVGLWWLVTAMLFTLHYRHKGLPFNLGWWAFTFPLGVYTLATLGLYHVTGFVAFAVMGVLLALLLGAFWFLVLFKTLHALIFGDLLRAPCLIANAELPPTSGALDI